MAERRKRPRKKMWESFYFQIIGGHLVDHDLWDGHNTFGCEIPQPRTNSYIGVFFLTLSLEGENTDQ